LFLSLFPLLLLFNSLGIIVNLGLAVNMRGLVCVSGDGLWLRAQILAFKSQVIKRIVLRNRR
jgi:hypothetical protein